MGWGLRWGYGMGLGWGMGWGLGWAGQVMPRSSGSTWKFFSDCFSFLSEIGKQNRLSFHLLNVLSRLENGVRFTQEPRSQQEAQ